MRFLSRVGLLPWFGFLFGGVLCVAGEFEHRLDADFRTGPPTPPLTVVREAPALLRFLPDSAGLGLRSSRGDVFERSNDCRNLVCIPLPPGDFEAVLAVRSFVPTHPVQHLSLGVFADEDNLVRVTYWWRGTDRGVSLDREDRAIQQGVGSIAADFGDGPFRLILRREGDTVFGAFAGADGERREVGSLAWGRGGRYLGFYAANSSRDDCPSVEAVIEGVTVVSAEPVPDQIPDAPPAAAAKPTLHAYEEYGWLRGLNAVPSWGARIEEAWWSYDPVRFRAEMGLVRSIHGNCVRLWIEFSAWMADPELITARFLDAVAAIDEAGMKVMPCLFNRWHDWRWDYGGTYTEDLYRDWGPKLDYVRAIVTPLARDERVLCWDLCNEPQAFDLNAEVNRREYAFLDAVGRAVREAGALQPITVGTMTGGNIETFAPLCDVLCAHPYARTQDGLAAAIAELKATADRHGKPLLVNECIPGCLDDAIRAEAARYGTEMLADAGFGWMGWSIKEGKAISTRRDRYDGNGVDGTGFHAWFTTRDALRPGLEFLLDEPKRRAPWETL